MNVSKKALRDYLQCTSIYKETSPKKKTGLIEMTLCGCITWKIRLKRSRRYINKTSKSNIK